MWFSSIMFVILHTLISSTHSQDFCQNPQNQIGVCINIRNCQVLLNLLQSNSQDSAVRIFVQSSLCGFDGNNPRVCCPTGNNATDITGNNNEERGPKEIVKTQYGPLYSPQCGLSDMVPHRVVGGEPALLGAWPWITALGYTHPADPNRARWLCGGSLISSRHVLTAGHCVHRRVDLYKVRIGDLDLDNDSDGAFPFEDFIDRKVVHPDYSPTSFTNDIAVLRTTREVPFTPNLHPICLPVDDKQRNKNYELTYPFVAGWGSTSFHGPTSSRLMQIQIPVRTEQECKNAFENIQVRTVIDHRVLCAGYSQGGKDTCQGDSGGPLMTPTRSGTAIPSTVYYIIGVVSYGVKCAEPGIPGVYTKVTAFLDFITSQMV